MWVKDLPSSNIDDRNSYHVYEHFNDAVMLNNNQLDGTDSDSVEFNIILELVREGIMTKSKINFNK